MQSITSPVVQPVVKKAVKIQSSQLGHDQRRFRDDTAVAVWQSQRPNYGGPRADRREVTEPPAAGGAKLLPGRNVAPYFCTTVRLREYLDILGGAAAETRPYRLRNESNHSAHHHQPIQWPRAVTSSLLVVKLIYRHLGQRMSRLSRSASFQPQRRRPGTLESSQQGRADRWLLRASSGRHPGQALG
ncbi:hypothetical protein CIB48_g7254 [Xylaria polymorpha]|nr:hypothetical protein CIB48_g7254 [Xylaria polymorpha]